MSKYNSKKTTIDGIAFDSKDEAKYYEVLKIKKSKGEIYNFELQPKFILIEGFKKGGKTYRQITYTPDFLIYHIDGTEELVDVKGMTTQQGELRIKLFHWKYRDKKLTILARNLKYGDKYGFIDFYELKKIRAKNKKRWWLINKVILIGRLTKDPELRYTPVNGTAVTTATIAVDNYNSKTGEKGADFIPVVIWGKQAENTAQYMTKGSQVAISGRITTRSYDAKDGTKRYVTEVVADMINGVQFLSKGKVNEMNQDPGNTFDSMGFDDGMTPVDDGDMPF